MLNDFMKGFRRMDVDVFRNHCRGLRLSALRHHLVQVELRLQEPAARKQDAFHHFKNRFKDAA